MHLQIGILISFLVPICIMFILILVKQFYQIPDIEKLRQILYESNIHSIELETKFYRITKITVSKSNNQLPVIPNVKKEKPYKVVISDLVGKFYSTDHQDGTKYSEENQTITSGTMVGYIFSLHLKNEVISEHEGKIVKILLKDGDRVEFGQAIMHIEIE